MTKIKICGLRRKEDILAVNEALPDYIGFVFSRSRRQIDERTALELKQLLHPQILSVGVFVNEEPDRIKAICDSRIIDMVQLHGDETPRDILKLKEYINRPIIKAIRVSGSASFHNAEDLCCDYLLLDAYQKGQYGGTGEGFDWSVIPKLHKECFIAGGIEEGNVGLAIHMLNPYCIDVSSGVETNGFKDKVKIHSIVTKIRSRDGRS